jgi:hypothetical protein
LAGVGAVAGAEKTASFTVANLAGQSRCSREREDKTTSPDWIEPVVVVVFLLEPGRDAIVKEVPTGGGSEGVPASKDGKTACVNSEAGDLVHEVDTASGAITRDAVVGLRPRRFAATPDDKDCG